MKKLTIAIVALGLFILCGGFNVEKMAFEGIADAVASDCLVLTDSSPDTTVGADQDVVLYGSEGVNEITLQSGAKARIKNSKGSNHILIESDYKSFTVFRSGSTVILNGSDGTNLRIPATAIIQKITFNDGAFNLTISNDEVMLEDQIVHMDEVQIEAPERIRGYVFESDGVTPLANVCVNVFAGNACDFNHVAGRQTDENGYYSIPVEAGTYYLNADAVCDNTEPVFFVNEWYDGSQGTTNCNDAIGVEVVSGQTVTDTNFILDGAGIISGYVFESDGETPIANACVNVNTVPACDWNWVAGNKTDENGYYSITVAPGVYAISTDPDCGESQSLGFMHELYDGAQGTRVCELAAEVDVSDGSNVTGINFYLDKAVTISGYVFEEDGVTPIADICVNVNNPPACDWNWAAGNQTDENGYYSILVDPGVYYISTNPDCGDNQDLDFGDEWYDGGQGNKDCGAAMAVDVSDGNNASNINFFLGSEPRIDWADVAVVYDGELRGGFGLKSKYEDLLEGAVLTGPDSFSAAYDLVADVDGPNEWWPNFGSTFPYGDYTLTISFTDGAKEIFERELIEVEILPVPGDSVEITRNSNGSIDVAWQVPSAQQLYQVRIYDDDGKRYYKGSAEPGISNWTIPAEDLKDLVSGSNYYIQVRTYDEAWMHVERGEKHYFTYQ